MTLYEKVRIQVQGDDQRSAVQFLDNDLYRAKAEEYCKKGTDANKAFEYLLKLAYEYDWEWFDYDNWNEDDLEYSYIRDFYKRMK